MDKVLKGKKVKGKAALNFDLCDSIAYYIILILFIVLYNFYAIYFIYFLCCYFFNNIIFKY